MSLRKSLLLVIACSVAVLTGNAEDVKHDGNWWRSQMQPAKYHHAARFLDGTTTKVNFLEFGMSAVVPVREDPSNPYTTAGVKYVQITGVQLVDGLDKLYSDDRNSGIQLSNAVTIVVHAVAGTPHNTLVKMIEEYRKPGC